LLKKRRKRQGFQLSASTSKRSTIKKAPSPALRKRILVRNGGALLKRERDILSSFREMSGGKKLVKATTRKRGGKGKWKGRLE